MKLIELTLDSNGARVYINPDTIMYFHINGGFNGVFIQLSHGSLIVRESTRDIADMLKNLGSNKENDG